MKEFHKICLTTLAAVLSWTGTEACTNFIVTKGASTDGSVMVTYAADSHQLYGCLYHTPGGRFRPGSMLRVGTRDAIWAISRRFPSPFRPWAT